jgi:hypothetical protein
MLSRIVLAIVTGIVTSLVFMLVGSLLVAMQIGWVVATGAFFREFAGLLGLLAALWYFFSGYVRWPQRP